MRAAIITCVCILILCIAGCARHTEAITVAPALDELPPPDKNIPTISAKIGVEGEFSDAARLPVPQFPKIEPTPEQKKILGEPPPKPELDAIAFYRPPRGPAQGVAPEDFSLSAGVSGMGGAQVGLEEPYASSGVLGEGGVSAAEYSTICIVAQRGRARRPIGAVGPGWSVSVGEGPPVHIAARATRY